MSAEIASLPSAMATSRTVGDRATNGFTVEEMICLLRQMPASAFVRLLAGEMDGDGEDAEYHSISAPSGEVFLDGDGLVYISG